MKKRVGGGRPDAYSVADAYSGRASSTDQTFQKPAVRSSGLERMAEFENAAGRSTRDGLRHPDVAQVSPDPTPNPSPNPNPNPNSDPNPNPNRGPNPNQENYLATYEHGATGNSGHYRQRREAPHGQGQHVFVDGHGQQMHGQVRV